jgi:hypothetical protein
MGSCRNRVLVVLTVLLLPRLGTPWALFGSQLGVQVLPECVTATAVYPLPYCMLCQPGPRGAGEAAAAAAAGQQPPAAAGSRHGRSSRVGGLGSGVPGEVHPGEGSEAQTARAAAGEDCVLFAGMRVTVLAQLVHGKEFQENFIREMAVRRRLHAQLQVTAPCC